MASMASSTLPRTLFPLSPRGNAIVRIIAGPVHLKSTGGIGRCTKRNLELSLWNKTTRGKQRRLSIVRATVEEEESSQKNSSGAVDGKLENATAGGTGGSNSEKDRKSAARAERGKNTAIITGAISVLLGVGYLVLLQILDTRGIELIPPPPEAFDP